MERPNILSKNIIGCRWISLCLMTKESSIVIWMYSIQVPNEFRLGNICLDWADIEVKMNILIVWYSISRCCELHSEVHRQHMIVVMHRLGIPNGIPNQVDDTNFEVSRSQEWQMKWSKSLEAHSLQLDACIQGSFSTRWQCIILPLNENQVHLKTSMWNDLDIVQFNK